MNIPAPALFAMVVLLAWPAAQLVAVLLWRRSLSKMTQEAVLTLWDRKAGRTESFLVIDILKYMEQRHQYWLIPGLTLFVIAFGLAALTPKLTGF
jgi:hypothetical protein